MNTFTLLGRMVKDPELLYGAQSNKAYCRFTIAVDRKFGQEKKADFFELIAFDRKAETIAKYIKKGEQILVTGNLQIEQYEKNGEKVTKVKLAVGDFDFVGNKADRDSGGASESTKDTKKRDEFMDIPDTADFTLPFR